MNISATKRIAKNFSWLLVGNSLNGILAFFLIVYIARVLGAAAFGLYNFAQAFLIYLILIVDSGLSIFGMREIARERKNAGKTMLNIFAIRLLIACLLYILVTVLLIVLPVDRQIRLLFVATFLFIFYRALSSEWVFQGLETMEYIPIFKMLVTLLTFAFAVWLVRGPLDLINFPLIQAVCGLIIALIFVVVLFGWILPAKIKMLSPKEWLSVFWQALPLGASLFLIQIYMNLDTIMLGFMDRKEVVGYYNAAYKIFYVCLGIIGAWQQTALPVMTQRMANDLHAARVFLNKYARLTALAFIPLTLVVFLLAPAIISLVFGTEYLAAVPALQILIWQLLSMGIGSIFGVLILIPAGRYNHFFISVGVGAVVNIIFNFLLIPQFSMLGAAVATIFAEVTAMLTSAYFARRVFGVEMIKQFILPGTMALIALLGYWIVYLLALPLAFVPRQIVAGIVYLLVYGTIVLVVERRFILSFAKEIMNR